MVLRPKEKVLAWIFRSNDIVDKYSAQNNLKKWALCRNFAVLFFALHTARITRIWLLVKKEGCKILIGFEYEVQLLHEIACSLAV